MLIAVVPNSKARNPDRLAKRRLLHQLHYHRFGDEMQQPTMRLFHRTLCFMVVRVDLMMPIA